MPPVVALLTGGVGHVFLKLVDMVGGRCYRSDLEDAVGSFIAKPVCCEAWVRVFKAHIRGIDSGHGV